jgi:hypothetical protein
MQRVFHEYKLFNAKNFMAGLNKIVDEIGEQMADPFKVGGREINGREWNGMEA